MDKTIPIVQLFLKHGMTGQEQAEMYHEFLREKGLTEEFYAELEKAEAAGLLDG